MPRPKGSRNLRHDERRGALLALLRARLHRLDGPPPSWRELAAAAGVSLATLQHYFGRREDVVRAVMEADLAGAGGQLAAMAAPSGPFARSIRDALDHMAAGLRHGGLDRLFAAGLVEGLGNPIIGPAFLRSALEPTLQAAETRLGEHVARGEMRAGDTRAAAIALIAPALLAFLHQNTLSGDDLRPLDLDRFVADHAEAFVRAWAA